MKRRHVRFIVRRFWTDRPLASKGLFVVSIPVIALVLTAALFLDSEEAARDARAWVTRTFQVKAELETLLVHLVEAESAVGEYLLTREDAALDRYEKSVHHVVPAIVGLGSLLEDPTHRQSLLRLAVLSRQRPLTSLADRARAGETVEAIGPLVGQSRSVMRQMREELDRMQDRSDELLSAHVARAQQAQQHAVTVTVGGAAAGLLGGVVGMLLFTTGISSRIRAMCDNARRLADGTPLVQVPEGCDEIGVLGERLDTAAALLAQRDRELTDYVQRLERAAAEIADLYDNAPVAYHSLDGDGRILRVNRTWLKWFGYSEEEVVGVRLPDILTPAGVRTFHAEFEAFKTRGWATDVEFEVVRKDGTAHPVNVTASAIRDADGRFVASRTSLFDLTARRRAQWLIAQQTEELRATERFLDLVVDNIPNMMFVKDAATLRFVRVNRAGEVLLGVSRDRLVGKSDYDVFPSDQAESFVAKDREVLERGTLVDIPEEIVATPYGLRVLHTKELPILDGDGVPQYLLGISEDITEQREAEERVRLAQRETERASRAKSEFLSRMSHDLRTPLNAILGFAQLLEMQAVAPDQRDAIEQILRGGHHLLDLINEVLDIARIESGNLSLSPEPVALLEVVSRAVELVRPLAAQRDVALEARFELADVQVRADSQRLTQVLLNLLSNAVKYNRTGGAVIVACERHDSSLRVTITDTGFGIPPQKVALLFTPFERLGAESTATEGTGLGLALSKALAEAMGGHVGFETQVDVGSTFWVELPIVETLPIAAQPASDAAMAPRAAAVRGTVLYVEDNRANMQLMLAVLAHRPGVALVTAANGTDGLETARRILPDLILLDLHLPDICGEEVLRLLWEDPASRNIPVAILSADAMPHQARRLRYGGAISYLTKPVDITRLLGLIDEVLSAARSDQPHSPQLVQVDTPA